MRGYKDMDILKKSFWARVSKNGVINSLMLYGGAAGLAQFFSIIYAILLARILSPSDYGIYAACYTTSSLTSYFINWGLDSWLLREAVLSHEPQKLTSKVIVIKSIFSVVWGPCLFIILNWIRPEIYLANVLMIAILDIWLDSCFNTCISFMNALKRINQSSVLLLLSRGTRLASLGVIFFFGVSSPFSFAAARLASTVLILSFSLLAVRPEIKGVNFNSLPQIYRAALTFGWSDLLAQVYLQSDIALLSLLVGDKRTVGNYAPAESLINALFALPAAGYAVLLPIFVKTYEVNNPQHFIRNTRYMYLAFAAAGLLLWIIVGSGAQFMTNLVLGKNFSATGIFLAILSPIIFLKFLNFAHAILLVSTGLQRQRIAPQFFSAAANIVLNLIFIPIWGATAAAVVYVISEIILLCGYSFRSFNWFTIYTKTKAIR